MTSTLYNSMDEAIAAALNDWAIECRAPHKVGERIYWSDWLEAHPVPEDFVIDWVATIHRHFYDTTYNMIAWKPVWSEKWSVSALESITNYDVDDFGEAVIFEVEEDNSASDTDSTATAPDAEEAPTEPLPRD